MSYREKESLVNIFSGIIIAAVYGWIIYQRHLAGKFDFTEDYSTWGTIFLIFIGVSIIARIIIYIIFHAINAIATREEDIPKEDERDKIVKLLATRNSHYTFSFGLMLTFLALAVGMPIYGIFIAFIISGVLSEIVENCSQIYFYRRGV